MIKGAPRNRRITPFSPVTFSGPAANHRWIAAAKATFGAEGGVVHCGTLANCAGGRTPWGTYLSSEENFDSAFFCTDANTALLGQAQADAAWVYASGNFGTPLWARAKVTPSPRQFDPTSSRFSRWNCAIPGRGRPWRDRRPQARAGDGGARERPAFWR